MANKSISNFLMKLSLTNLKRTKRLLETVDTKKHGNSRNHPRIQDEIEIER